MEPKNLTGNYGPTCFEARAQGMKSNSKNFTKKIPTMGQKMTLLPLFSLLFSFLSIFFLLFFYSSLLFTLCVLSLSFLFLLLYLSSSASSHFSLPFFPFKIQLFQWQAFLNKSYWCELALSGIPRMLCELPLWCSMGKLRSILGIPEEAAILEQIVTKKKTHVVEVKEGWKQRE